MKLNDDILSACRYSVMMRRHAKVNVAERPMTNFNAFGTLDAVAGY